MWLYCKIKQVLITVSESCVEVKHKSVLGCDVMTCNIATYAHQYVSKRKTTNQ